MWTAGCLDTDFTLIERTCLRLHLWTHLNLCYSRLWSLMTNHSSLKMSPPALLSRLSHFRYRSDSVYSRLQHVPVAHIRWFSKNCSKERYYRVTYNIFPDGPVRSCRCHWDWYGTRIPGPLFFGAADAIEHIVVKDFIKCLVIRMRSVPALDFRPNISAALNRAEEIITIS